MNPINSQKEKILYLCTVHRSIPCNDFNEVMCNKLYLNNYLKKKKRIVMWPAC